MCGDDGDGHFPYVRRRGRISLIGLSSGVPTAPFLASGRLGSQQRHRLEACLSAEGVAGQTRIVMIHHAPHRTGARLGRGLTDANSLEAILMRAGAELVIHGHNHRHSIAYLPKRAGSIPVVGVASASAVPGSPSHRAAYHLFTIDRADKALRISMAVRAYGADGHIREERVVDLLQPRTTESA
jgi:3',5'-cyclic AMP phosphodiesterase CpdA